MGSQPDRKRSQSGGQPDDNVFTAAPTRARSQRKRSAPEKHPNSTAQRVTPETSQRQERQGEGCSVQRPRVYLWAQHPYPGKMPQDPRGSVLIGSAFDLSRSLAGCSPWGRKSRAQLSSLTTAA
ncbi:unnamed protein product [Rangifer tarandus platyrhynchus]|uniref:Uncharacterized protein n=1 Tax=Rangifer tarandus platyrhynchus TaxID=3082113 RepID=A0AC59ZFV3_RANTA